MQLLKDYIQLHFLVILWGFTAILGLLISLPSVELVLYRTFISLIGIGLYLLYKNISFRLNWKDAITIISVGVIVGIHWLLFFLSARVSTASVCLAGLATSSFWTSFLEPWITRKKVSALEVCLGIFVVIGLLVIFRFEIANALGLVLGILSALAQSIFSIFNGKFTKKFSPHLITFYEMVGALCGVLLFLPFYIRYFTNGNLHLIPTSSDLFYISILAIVCTVYAYSRAIDLMKRISAFSLNLTINLEPVYGMLLAFFIIGGKEKMTLGFYIGALIILGTVISYPLIKYFKLKMNKTPVTIGS